MQALTEANNSTLAGFTDGRLPNLKELSSIVERKCFNPAINEAVFPGTPSAFFWSASAFANDSNVAWVVVFNDGFDGVGGKFNSGRVRLVRGGQLFDSFQFTIGGLVSGLAGSGLVLQNNGGDNLSINANGSFTFPIGLTDGAAYNVTVQTQPGSPSQTCTVGNGSGNLSGANVTNVTVNCTTNTFTVGGTVSGLAGSGLVLQNNAGDDLPIGADGTFTFATALTDGSAYDVTVQNQPNNPSQSCTVGNGSGTLSGANITNVMVSCTTNTFTIGGMVSG
ncbi:MAG: DUF1566 domain-containing protein, partial [Methylococcales bacterium]